MIVSFGDAVLDLFAFPRGSDVETAEYFVPRQGGAPANVAVVAARMGARVRFLGAVGRDGHGDRLLGALREAGVDADYVVRMPQRTGVTFVRVGEDGSRSFLSYRLGGADLSLGLAQVLDAPEHPLTGARWLHLSSSSTVAEPMAGATWGLVEAAKERGVALSFDLNIRTHLWDDRERMARAVRALAERASLVKASEEDLQNMGLAPTLEALESIAPNARAVLTLAERGAVARVAGREVSVPAPRVDVVDATGAGDAFTGALLACLSAAGLHPGNERWDAADALAPLLALACEVGARAVTVMGATDGVRDLSRERARLPFHPQG